MASTPSTDLDLRGFPPYIVARIRAIEAELDLTWPGWRERLPFHRVEYNVKARIKWLLKRRVLLSTREGGVPCPRDWEVIVVRDGTDPKKCYAHPVVPSEAPAEDARVPPAVVAVDDLAVPAAEGSR